MPKYARLLPIPPASCCCIFWPTGLKNVGELGAALDINQPTVSRHLKVLRERGMVNAERLGTTVTYSLADRRVIEALDLLRAVMTDNLLQKTALVDLLNQAS